MTEAELEFELRKLANTVKRDTIESCAKIAAGHNGISPKDSRDIATKIRRLNELSRIAEDAINAWEAEPADHK